MSIVIYYQSCGGIGSLTYQVFEENNERLVLMELLSFISQVLAQRSKVVLLKVVFNQMCQKFNSELERKAQKNAVSSLRLQYEG